MPQPPTEFRSQTELVDYLTVLEERVSNLESENKLQKLTIDDLFHELNAAKMNSREAQPLPQSNLFSPKFMTRAFAVWGHHFVAQLIISLVFFVLYLILILMMMFAAQ